jgi:hypothetical protein
LTQVKAGSRRGASAGVYNLVWSNPMMDIVMMALAAGFFAVSIAYVYACEEL